MVLKSLQDKNIAFHNFVFIVADYLRAFPFSNKHNFDKIMVMLNFSKVVLMRNMLCPVNPANIDWNRLMVEIIITPGQLHFTNFGSKIHFPAIHLTTKTKSSLKLFS
jgi:hypothetical protein